ncbi:phosphatase PAP2 family protein [Kribbella endophytica]
MTTTEQHPGRTTGRYAVPLAGAALAIAGTLGAIALADSATESDGLAAFDPDFSTDAVAARTAPLTALARSLTFIGNTPVLVILTILAAVLLYRVTRSWRAPGLLVVAMAGSAALTVVLKLAVGRHRPGIDFVLGPVSTGYAFPSGHTLNSTVFFGALTALIWLGLRSATAKAGIALAALLLSAGIGISRVYLGYHWATDVLAGWTIAVAWLAIVLSAAHLWHWVPKSTEA